MPLPLFGYACEKIKDGHPVALLKDPKRLQTDIVKSANLEHFFVTPVTKKVFRVQIWLFGDV